MSLPVSNTLALGTGRAFVSAADTSPSLSGRSRELGPPTLYDGSQGIDRRVWVAETTGTAAVVYPDDDPLDVTTLLTGASITTVSLAFNQNGFPFLSYVDAGTPRLYWYNPLLPGYETLTLTGAITPILTMDDKRRFSTANNANDVLLFYMRLGVGLCMRQQRDRFLTEYVVNASATGRITRCGLNSDYRMQVETV